MPTDTFIVRELAAAFLNGPLDVDTLVHAGQTLLGRKWAWLGPLARRIRLAFPGESRPRKIALIEFLRDDHRFRKAIRKRPLRLKLAQTVPEMVPVKAARTWRLPALPTPGALAEWLTISITELDWFANRWPRTITRRIGRAHHYHYRCLGKPHGQPRLIESPKNRLKTLQRKIFSELIQAIPTHDAAHGFCPGRSPSTFAARHVGRAVVIKFDLEDFFPSITFARLTALFMTVGYPETVAGLLAGLCSNTTPVEVWPNRQCPSADREAFRTRLRYSTSHLPQGAPTSPALANLCAFRLDRRLTGLADTAVATYTRYADDLVFSGDEKFARHAVRFADHVAAIVCEEGFTVNHRKTRVMKRGVRQQVTGIVVNSRLNTPRDDYDHLKAILYNCVRRGPASQNRDNHADFASHLRGRISYMNSINSVRGQKLAAMFEQIAW